MNRHTSPSILIVGAGAIGSLYGAILHRAGLPVSLVARSDSGLIRRRGVRVDSTDLGCLDWHPEAVHADTTSIPEPPDILLLTVKVLDDLDRVALIRPAVGPYTTIALIENGLDIETPIRDALPDNPLISCIAFVAASRTAPGTVEHKAYGRLVVGNYPAGLSVTARDFAGWIEAGGLTAKLTEDVITERWRKAVWNAAFNTISVAGGGVTTSEILAAPGGEDMMLGLMREVCAVAAAAGHPLPAELPEKSLASTHNIRDYYTSMALDYLQGRPLELDAITGNVLRTARRLGVPVPLLSNAHALARLQVTRASRG
ncbi:2-dehydropantoate 2-reductase [Methylonatrum kenyense]|uniref:ketopantoate reductase family protein n=1 Tax=Methylonatrum kenyense TaxID=455253 RepID=UPI0020BDF174|nr:2-dehydropantoate 2-reductase [Methylonatrum kenyense]MCK8517247.1 2-dehydropantoate 2-reductase [Methylonatrum kenyense]